jgi:FkbM family methyltransferase
MPRMPDDVDRSNCRRDMMAMTLPLHFLARRRLQPLWRTLLKLSLAGLGFMNADERRNGERTVLRRVGAFLAARNKPACVFDVGANTGCFVADCMDLFRSPVIHAFEPHPDSFAVLRERFAGNPQIIVNQLGLADTGGMQELVDYRAGASPHASFVREVFTDIYRTPIAVTSAMVDTLDAYCRRRAIERVDYLKIDVEGYERKVLAGAQAMIAAGGVDFIQLEFNVHNAIEGFSLFRLSKLLDGFAIYRIIANGMVPLCTPDVAYNSLDEIYKYANLLAVRLTLAEDFARTGA